MERIPTLSLREPSPEKLAQELLQACTTFGFFYLTDVPFDRQTLDHVWQASETLFLTKGGDADRQREASKDRAGHTGYTALHEEKLDVGADKDGSEASGPIGDCKESFYIAQLSGPSARQKLPALLGPSRASLDAFFDRCTDVCTQLLQIASSALQLDDAGYFSSQHNAFDDRLRLIHYPPAGVRTSASASSEIRAGAHTDYGSFTLLFQREVSGLQVLVDDQGGQRWIDVPPPAPSSADTTTIVVNVGDALEFWTGGLFRSAQHRVAMPRTQAESRSRFSIAYFSQPNAEAVLDPVVGRHHSLSSSTDARGHRSHEAYVKELQRKGIQSPDQRLTGGDHLASRLRASYAGTA